MNWGAIFDWDGVVIDSSKQHELSWDRLAEERGLALPEGHFKKGFGMKNAKIIPEILEWTKDDEEIEALSLRKEELYREIVQESGIEALPGVSAWLDRLEDAGVPRVIGSSTARKNIEVCLGVLGFEGRFDGIVCGDDVSKGKPDPEVFLKAAEKIGCAPDYCVVFEDAHVGIEAARAGGMKVVGVATTHPPEELGNTDRVVQRLDELTVAEVSAWF